MLFRSVRDVRRQQIVWTYLGPDGVANTADNTPVPYGMTNYVDRPEFYGFRGLPWVSNYKAWRSVEANPAWWTKTPAQLVTEEQFRINNSERLEEGVRSFYAQAELGLFRNRLKVLTGVRYEHTSAEGEGPLHTPDAVWMRDPDGTFAHNAAGARLRRQIGRASCRERV